MKINRQIKVKTDKYGIQAGKSAPIPLHQKSHMENAS
jgi:hypothetical protein